MRPGVYEFRPGDTTLVTDTRTGAIASCLHLISQTWTYGGVPIGVGQPELIGTRPAYRGRGLVRAQFDVVHGWSAERGHRMQAIAGIPWFYRQFGYELALERRLAVSACAGHTGSLTLGFYRAGVRLAFERGKVTAIEPWTVDVGVRGVEFGRPSGDPRRPLAMFPDLTFLQLLFGFRALAEIEAAFPDCIVRTGEARALLEALSPKTPSSVWPVG